MLRTGARLASVVVMASLALGASCDSALASSTSVSFGDITYGQYLSLSSLANQIIQQLHH
jgi:hypothetical protein